jgi:uncharacterized membrane protein YsdA (DUF1294 family)/cold shock CspA family protein
LRSKGILVEWNDARGFGFIQPAEAGQRVFCHVSAFHDRSARPTPGMRLTYSLGRDGQGRLRAEEVRFSSRATAHAAPPAPPGRPHPQRALVVSVVFVLSLVGVAVAGRLNPWVPAWYALASLVALVAYWLDKADAQRGRWRTPERALQTLALVGGWPGAWIAQQALRHKTRKPSFQVTFWACVVLNLAALAWMIWNGGHPLTEVLVQGDMGVEAVEGDPATRERCAGAHPGPVKVKPG